jgi:hypothetical protein
VAMHWIRASVVAALSAAVLLPAGAAQAVIVISPGANTASTPRLDLDFSDTNPERVNSVKWRDSNGNVGANLAAAAGGPAGGCDPENTQDFWGESNTIGGAPQPVGPGNAGPWTARGGRTVEIASSRPMPCTGDTTVTPVRTRYTFFNVGDTASKVRVERTFSFAATNPGAYGAASMRAYIPRMPLAQYSQVLHPDAAGTALVTDSSPLVPAAATSWNGTWLALNDPATNAGLFILRETSNSARIMLDGSGASNASAVDLFKPGGGWNAPVTETEWLCFYDAASWPIVPNRVGTRPSGCSVVPVPINTGLPAISGTPKVGTALTSTTGTWDNAPGLATQWLRCTGASCGAIPGATSTNYTPVLADEGRTLRVDVTATATGGEVDTASSAQTGVVATGPPQNTAAPAVSGEARQDEVLTGTQGAWSGAPTSFQYQWLRCPTAALAGCANVAGATTTTYKLTKDDVGATMRFRVLATNGVGTSAPGDSAGTGEVQRLVVKALLSISPPNGSCTGINTTFDGSASKTPNTPIARYRFTYQSLPAPALAGLFFAVALSGSSDATGVIKEVLKNVPAAVLYDGKNPSFTTSFTWNRQIAKHESTGGKAGDFVRDPIFVTLTVTDKAGATSTRGPGLYGFSQTYSSGPRTACPKVFPSDVYVFAVTKVLARATSSAAVLALPCATKIDCAGSLQLYTVVGKKARAAAKKPVLLASNKFFSVRGRKTGSIKAKWTSAGSKLAKKKKPFLAVVKLTSINPTTGKKTVKSSKPLKLKP